MVINLHTVVYFLSFFWFLFFAFWITLAFYTKKNIYRQSQWTRLAFIVIVLALAIILSSFDTLSVKIIPYTATTQIVGIILCGFGILFAIAARVALGRNWSGPVTIKREHELISHGPYSIVRHPIYTGLLVAFFGTVLTLSPSIEGVLFIIIVMTAYWFKLKYEEEILMGEFPAEYSKYKRRVRYALLPFIF